MAFQLTKSIGAIGVLSFLFWMFLSSLNPIERRCTIDYYGRPDTDGFAETILDLQMSTYDTYYNYHRALNAENCTQLHGKFFCMLGKSITYYGECVRENTMSRYDALLAITEQIEEFYKQIQLAELRINWSVPIVMMDISHSDAELIDYHRCTATLNVSDDLDFEAGDNITCYVPSFGGTSCDVSIKKYSKYDGLTAFLTYIAGICTITVGTIVMIAVFARLHKRYW